MLLRGVPARLQTVGDVVPGDRFRLKQIGRDWLRVPSATLDGWQCVECVFSRLYLYDAEVRELPRGCQSDAVINAKTWKIELIVC